MRWCGVLLLTFMVISYCLADDFTCDQLSTSTDCNCGSLIKDEHEVSCPRTNELLSVRIKKNEYVIIICSGSHNETIYDYLPTELQLGRTPAVFFRNCPVIKDQPIKMVTDRIGITDVFELTIQNRNTNGLHLHRKQLSGFNNLTKLNLAESGFTFPQPDAFHDLKQLKQLLLRHNNILLPPNVFCRLENLEVLELGGNKLTGIDSNLFCDSPKLRMLNLWGNKIQRISKEMFENIPSINKLDLSINEIEELPDDVFSNLPNLKDINLSNNKLKSLPKNLFKRNEFLTVIRLIYNHETIEELPSGLFSFLPNLETVNVSINVSRLPNDLFVGSYNLKTLKLYGNSLYSSLPANLLANQTNLNELDLTHNRIEVIHDRFFIDTIGLKTINLSHNRLQKLNNQLFSKLIHLEKLYVDHNKIMTIEPRAFENTIQIKILDLQHNIIHFGENKNDSGLFIDVGNTGPFKPLANLKELLLNNNSIDSIISDWRYGNSKLHTLNLSFNKITMISITDLQFLSQNITVNLSNNKIETIDFKPYKTIAEGTKGSTSKVNVLVGMNPINCDCSIQHFIEFIGKYNKREANVNIEYDGLKCMAPEALNGKRVSQLRLDQLICPLGSQDPCPAKCNCNVRTFDKTLIINCANQHLTDVPEIPSIPQGLERIELHIENNNITNLPTVPETNIVNGYNYVYELHAQNNLISTVEPKNIPTNLTLINLSHNRIEMLNDSFYQHINKSRLIGMLDLSENPWKCTCDIADTIEFLKVNTKLTANYESTKCTDGRQLILLSRADVCPIDYTPIIILGILAVCVILILAIIAFYYKYELEIKIWLFDHNLLMWLISEEDLDKDKKYDAFISYSHKDEDFIVDHLQPMLESGSTPYKLCLHTRDWLPGEFIHDQIITSVEDSKRTIVVLSPNFIESVWGRMEFKAAHKSAITENRTRVIVIIYGDLEDTKKLDPELQAYLRMNTYVKWGDPWFWQKLRYSLPHPPNKRDRFKNKSQPKINADDKLELIINTPDKLTNGNVQYLANGNHTNGIIGHVNGGFIINTNSKQSDV